MKTLTWAVLGASGFVGSAVVAELRARGHDVRALSAPRLRSTGTTAADMVREARTLAANTESPHAALTAALSGVDVLINAAGLATPGDGESADLTGANALLPVVAALAASAAGVRRFIHLSSASVQGHRAVIDETTFRAPFSPYSRSKALGEEAVEALSPTQVLRHGATGDAMDVVVLRATSVQGPSRPTTLSLLKVAASPLASVASPGTAATPVSSIDALAWFVAETGLFAGEVPGLVLQPWEGVSVTEVLEAAGGRAPLHLPQWLCRAAVATGYTVSRLLGERLHGPVRRLELMWFGQAQRPGWAQQERLVPTPAVQELLRQAQ